MREKLEKLAVGAWAAFCIGLVTVTGAAIAGESSPVVLTPTKLYDLIESLQKTAQNHGKRLLQVEKEIRLHNRFWADENTQDSLAHCELHQNFRLNELERKIAGVQKQITRLHSIKADK